MPSYRIVECFTDPFGKRWYEVQSKGRFWWETEGRSHPLTGWRARTFGTAKLAKEYISTKLPDMDIRPIGNEVTRQVYETFYE